MDEPINCQISPIMWALKRGWDWAITRMMAHHTGLPTRDASDRENDWGYFVQWAPLDHFHLLQREHPQLGHRFVHNPGLLGKLMKNADPATHLAPLSPDQPWPRSPFNAMRMFWGMKTRQWLDCRDVLGFSLNRDHELLSMGCAIFNWATLGLPRQHICFPELFVTELAAIRQIKEISMGGCCTRYLPHHIRAPFQRLRVSSADPLINGCLTLPPPPQFGSRSGGWYSIGTASSPPRGSNGPCGIWSTKSESEGPASAGKSRCPGIEGLLAQNTHPRLLNKKRRPNKPENKTRNVPETLIMT